MASDVSRAHRRLTLALGAIYLRHGARLFKSAKEGLEDNLRYGGKPGLVPRRAFFGLAVAIGGVPHFLQEIRRFADVP